MSQPKERIWIIYHFDVDDAGGLIPRPDLVAAGMAEIGVILSRVGGVITVATRRKEVAEGRVETLATVVRWRSFVPMERAQEAPVAEQETGAPPTPPPPGGEEVLAIPDDPITDPAPLPESDGPVTHESVAAEMPVAG